MKPTTKYIRVEDELLYIAPTAAGLEPLKKRFGDKLYTDKIGTAEVSVFALRFEGGIKFFQTETAAASNITKIYIFTNSGKQYKNEFMAFVPEPKVEPTTKEADAK